MTHPAAAPMTTVCQTCRRPGALRYRLPLGNWCDTCRPVLTPAGDPGSWWQLRPCNVCGADGVPLHWRGKRRQARCPDHMPDDLVHLLNREGTTP